jgi:predicted N-acetyltransferase YhbS
MSEPFAEDLREVRRFLHGIFGVERFRNDAYLPWFYRQSPAGEAVEIVQRDAEGIVGHVAGICQEYHSKTARFAAVFPQNLAVDERARGRGLMMRMNEACFSQWARAHGDGIVVGMPNAASTPGYTRLLGCRLVTPLPTFVCPPVWPVLESFENHDATPAFRASPAFDALADTLEYAPTARLSQRYSRELLRWRLGAPDARYAIHAGREAVVVSTVSRVRGIPLAVIVKTFRRAAAAVRGRRTLAVPRRGTDDRVSANGAIAAACRYHGAPAAVYAGFSASCGVLGLRVPERYKPAPLNLIVRSARRGFVDAKTLEFDTFEFLDFDAF